MTDDAYRGGNKYSRPSSPNGIAPLIDEADQLVAILTASANTARRRADQSA